MLLVDCLLDFLAHLDATEPGLARAIAVKTFLAKELKHQCDPTLKSKRDFSFDVEALSSELKLQAFFTDYQISCVDRDFQLCLDLLTNMGFFVGYTSSEKLLKFILFTQKFKSDVLGLNLSEINKQDFLKKLFKTQHRPTSSSVPISEVLLSSTIWNDLDVALLKPARQVVIDSSTTRLDLGMHAIQEHIAQRAKAGPNIKYTFCLFFVSFLSIALVAVSNSVRESPYLFRLLWALAYAINAVTVSIPGTTLCIPVISKFTFKIYYRSICHVGPH